MRVHHGSGNVPAHVAFFTVKKLAAGERAMAQLRLEAPAFVFAGDRFVVRDWAEQNTLAGGIVLDANANNKSLHSKARMVFLDERAKAPTDVQAYILSHLIREGAARRAELLVKSRFSDKEISATVSRLVSEGLVALAGDFVADISKWRELRQHAISVIDSWHRAHPEHTGVSLTDLCSSLETNLPFDDLFDVLIKDLCGSEFVQSGKVIHRATHRPTMSVQLRAAGSKLRVALTVKPFDPPSRSQLAPDPISQQALSFLVNTGDAVEVSEEVVMAAEHVKRATALIQDFIRTNGPATVSDLRQMLGSTRRVILPLLARLDRDGVTLRQGDKRTLRR